MMRSSLLLLAGFALLFMVGGADADEPLPLYYGYNWAEVDNEPPEVGDGAKGVSWDQTDVVTEELDISIAGQSIGFDPENSRIMVGTTVTWTNADTITHTVTDKEAQFDSFDIAPGENWSITFTEVGVFSYYCKYHPMMEGSITVLSSNKADEQARTNYIEVWTAQSYLVFWANFSMSDGDSIEVIAEKLEDNYDGTYPLESINLNQHNGFSIVCVSNGTVMGDSLIGDTGDEWKKYQIYLDSEKLEYNNLDYNPHEDNRHSFIFRVRGIEGSAAIGGVKLHYGDTGFYFEKAEHETLQYDIFPSLKVEIDYFAKNIGTEDNTFRMTPELIAQGTAYEGVAFDVYIMVRMNGEAFDSITTSSNGDGTWTHEFDMASDDEAMITVRFDAPDYDRASGEPASNRKFDVSLNAFDTGSDDELREPIQISLFIKPPQFMLGEITAVGDSPWIDELIFNKRAVLTGDSLDITATVWNEGNYASDVLVVFYVLDEEGQMYATPDGNQRLTRVASTTVDLMAPKPVLEDQGIYQTWYYATATWDEAFIPSDSSFETVSIYAQINPLLEQQDIDAGLQRIDEYRSNYIEGEGSVCGHCWESIGITVNPYIENVNIYLNITGDSRMALINATHTSEVTVTIRGPSGIIKFNESYSLGNGQTTSIQFSTDEGELFGVWELLLDSDDAESDFTYGYDWYNHPLHHKSNAAVFGSISIVKAQSKSVNCYVDVGYSISLQSFIFLPYSKPDEPCPEDQVFTSSLIASEDGTGVWTIQVVKNNPQVSVNYVHWYLVDEMGNTVSDGLASDVYGYYSGQGKAVIFIDGGYYGNGDGKLGPGDIFEVHPGEPDSDLAAVSDVTGYSFRLRVYAMGELQEGEKCVDGDTKTAEDGCNQCVCNDEEWICTEVACVDDDSDGTIPAVSLITTMVAVAVMALRRRPV